MNIASTMPKLSINVFLLIAALAVFSSTPVCADPVPANVQANVDKYKKTLVEWAANPQVVAAVKESNVKGALRE
jgi:hypothetical protein